jgi:hypothetical protein
VKGTIQGEWFVPIPGQSVTYRIYVNDVVRKELGI